MTRGRKPEVSPTLADEWLRRNETGESVKAIKKGSDFSENTIRKYVDDARERRETAQARTMVYRDALDLHFKDLISIARKLDQAVVSGKDIGSLMSDPLCQGLLEHQSKSKLWALLSEWSKVFTEVGASRENLRLSIKDKVEGDPLFTSIYQGGIMDGENLSKAMMTVVDSLIGGYHGINALESLRSEPLENNKLVNARYGGFDLGRLVPGNMILLAQALASLEGRLASFDQFKLLTSVLEHQKSIKEQIHKLLIIIILRRMVSGHCIFCPF